MNARFRLPIVALCFAGILAGCGSVTQGTQFQPPNGWTGTPSIFGRAQIWIKGGKDKNSSQFLMLIKGDPKNTHANFEDVPQNVAKDMKVISHGDTKLCGSQPAQEFRGEGTDRDGQRSMVEMTSTVIDNSRYVAMYIYPVNLHPDAEAETAIHSLCPVAAK